MFHFKWVSNVTHRYGVRLRAHVSWAVTLTLTAVLAGLTAAAGDATLFSAMGGERVLHDAVDRFSDLVVADDRINFSFAEANMAKFKQLLYEQLCELSGGPCHYTGRDMHTAHAKLHVNTAQFNALAEDLYIALGKAGVSYRQQNRLMALLAPMRREIANSQPPAFKPTPPAPPAADGR